MAGSNHAAEVSDQLSALRELPGDLEPIGDLHHPANPKQSHASSSQGK
jgi:hypothetical protein